MQKNKDLHAVVVVVAVGAQLSELSISTEVVYIHSLHMLIEIQIHLQFVDIKIDLGSFGRIMHTESARGIFELVQLIE